MNAEVEKYPDLECFSSAECERFSDFNFVDGDFEFDYRIYKRDNTNPLVVFLPAMVDDEKRAEAAPPHFHRWQWSRLLPGTVIAVADPSLRCDPGLPGGWFLGNANQHLIEDVCRHIKLLSRLAGVPVDKICFAGSSMGGFAALMMAGCLHGARAYAEVPQTLLWRHSEAAKAMRYFLGSSDPEVAEAGFMPRISVIEYFKAKKYIPPFRCVQQMYDPGMGKHVDPLVQFLASARTDPSMQISDFQVELMFDRERPGHSALKAEAAIARISDLMGFGSSVRET